MKRLLFIFLILAVFFSTPFFALGAEPIKILLVPGHDNEAWGTQYGNIKEASMNLAVASRIYDILNKDSRFEVHITRNLLGYSREFSEYFRDHNDEIISFKENAKREMQTRIERGDFWEKENPPHNSARNDVAVKLYGFNKWANEKEMDAVIHIHFNDHPRKTKWTLGQYTGFAIYMPDSEFANWQESRRLAAYIFLELEKKYDTSTYEKEKGGLISDQKLIALGANSTLSSGVRSVLVEYGYIYEKKFRGYISRHETYDDMAKLTASGIENYFFRR